MRAVVTLILLLASTAVAEKAPGPTTTRGRLVDAGTPHAHCGTFEIWTVVHFDVSIDPKGPRGTKLDPKRVPVAIPCIELSRPQYSKAAGNAGVVEKNKIYLLTLDAPRSAGKWGNKYAFAAMKIDDVP
jgi:hypothetical protein